MSETEMTERDKVLAAAEEKAVETNKTRTGKGTRVRVGQTRGKNPQVVSWEAFDESLTDSLPKDLSEFMDLTDKFGGKVEANILAWVVDGFNSAQYTAASDPIAEYVEASWPEEIQKGFRLAVRNYSVNAMVSIEDAVALIKPGIQKAVDAKKASEVKPAA